jgi:succinoglycan biosynthesis transport protein ExoP
MNEMSMEMQRHAVDSWQIIKNRLGPIILSFLLIFAVASIITYIMPRKYRGQVKMKIERDPNKVKEQSMGINDPTMMTENALKTEFETLTMSRTLAPVVEELNLTKQWNLPNARDALAKLAGNLDPQAGIRSDFVVIEAFDENAQLAADIANAVAKSYMQQRIEVEREQKERALSVLRKQVTDIELQATAARTKMQQAQKDAGIVEEVGGGSMARLPGYQVQTAEGSMAITREQQQYKIDSDILTLKSDIERLSSLSPDELVERASALKLENQSIPILLAEMQKAQISIEGAINGGLGRRHPTVLSLQAQIAKNKELISKAAVDHISGLKDKLAGLEANKMSLEEMNKKQNNNAIDKQSSTTVYLIAKRDVEQLEGMLLKKRETLSNEESSLEVSKSPATIWQEAQVETTPAKPRVMLNLTLGAIVGLMFGFGLAFALEYMDTSVKSLDDVERLLGVPVLAVIPKDVGVLHRSSGFTPDAEAYRILRTNIEFNRRNANANCITVVSGGAGEGKSTTLTNLAFVCAQGGYNVLLIDADLRRPRLHTLFDTSNAVGLTNYLTTDVQLEDVVLKTPVDNLYFLPSGVLPADSAGILNSQRMSDLIADVKSRFDLVLIDSPPILGVSDASVLANEADMTIIVVQHRKLPRQMLMRVKQAIENVGGNVLGVVLNNVDVRSDSSYSYYTSYYTYYSPTNMPGGAPEKRKRKKSTPPAAPSVAAAPRRDGADIF